MPLGWDQERRPTGPGDAREGSGPHSDPAGDSGAEPAPAPRGTSRLSRRSRRVIAACAVLVLVGALLIALPRLLGATTGPEQVTREFLQAVVDGDLETVRAHAQAAPNAAVLTPQMLDGAEDGLDTFEIHQVTVEAGTATVTASLRTGTARGEATFTLTSTDTGAFSPAVWELTPVELPRLRLDLPFGVQEIAIEGVSVPVAELRTATETFESSVVLQLLPGTYEVALPEPPPWLEAPQITLEVPPAFGDTAIPRHDVHFTLDETSQAEVQHQIDAALEDCMASTSSTPEGCPFA
ncbi:MAG: hypothetical protein L0H74_12990, partial [Brachybacterium sp.]|nr:hypothetical protein [Brachybacterium sp.]